jgi:hypothetical protein
MIVSAYATSLVMPVFLGAVLMPTFSRKRDISLIQAGYKWAIHFLAVVSSLFDNS